MFTLGCNLVFHTHCRRLTAITHVTDFGLVAERSCKLQFHMSLSLYFLESVAGDISDALQPWVAEPFSMGGGTSARQKNYINFLWFELATVTSQALKYGVITYATHEGLNYIILDKIIPL